MWLKAVRKSLPYVDPDLDPVLLVPGIAGSVLHTIDEAGHGERVWIRLFGADYKLRTKLWSRFDPSTGKTVSLDPNTNIVVPEDRYGLYAIDVLDPDMIFGQEVVSYFHDMIVEMLKWGLQEGKTLFGFGYDFRQSNRFQETMDRFAAKLESVYSASGGKRINIISHSMGGILVKCFMSLNPKVFEKYVKNWIAIAAPFQGAPGYITSTFLNGMSFVDGWEQNFFISKWSMHQLPSLLNIISNTFISAFIAENFSEFFSLSTMPESGKNSPQSAPSQRAEFVNIQPAYKFNGKNYYLAWSHVVKTYLKGKEKYKHLIESPPATTDAKFPSWEATDSMIMSWLWESMDPSISLTFMFLGTSKEIWEFMHRSYSKAKDEALVFELIVKAYSTKQGDKSIGEYATTLQNLWQELDQYETLKMKCTAALKKSVEKHRSYVFLAGFKSDFDPIRVQVLGKSEIPSLE